MIKNPLSKFTYDNFRIADNTTIAAWFSDDGSEALDHADKGL